MKSVYRKIIHFDLDAFYCAVEENRNPQLKGKAFAVGGRPDERGVVASCSYAARRFGVHSAMPMASAVRLCPELIVIRGNHRVYSEVSKKVMGVIKSTTPLVEQLSIDEAFMDVSDMPFSGEEYARQIQKRIMDAYGLPSSLGVATNKLVAKIATDVGKAKALDTPKSRMITPPNSITVVPPGTEMEFLAPLPVGILWGIGPKTSERLSKLGIQTVGELANWDREDLARRFGKHGEDMALRARGVDDRPVKTLRSPKSYSQETTFVRDVAERSVLTRTIQNQSEELSRRLQKKGLSAITIKIKIRWPDFTTLTRQSTLSVPTNDAKLISSVAEVLLAKVWKPGKYVRLLGVGVSGLKDSPAQLELWGAMDENYP